MQSASNITRAFGLPEVNVVETLKQFYSHQGLKGENLYEVFANSPIHHAARGPKTTDHRMLTEDVPYGLVPLTSFARLAGIQTPIMDAVISLSSVVCETDFRQSGRGPRNAGARRNVFGRNYGICLVWGLRFLIIRRAAVARASAPRSRLPATNSRKYGSTLKGRAPSHFLTWLPKPPYGRYRPPPGFPGPPINRGPNGSLILYSVPRPSCLNNPWKE